MTPFNSAQAYRPGMLYAHEARKGPKTEIFGPSQG